MFASDHGSHFRTRNLEYKRSAHDASIRIPLILAGPGFRGGERRSDLATNLDLLPTLVTVAGGADPERDGRSLQSGRDAPEDVLVQISESHIGRALRTHTHTYAARAPTKQPIAGHLRPAAERYVGTHLFDNISDPHQRRNLINDPASSALRDTLAVRLAERILHVEGSRPVVV